MIGTVSIPLAVTESYAEPRYDDLKHINAVLGSFSTNYNTGDSNRSHNIALAAQALDQAVIEAGATLSNQRVGSARPRGYRSPVYEEGEVRDGIGGGICQVSSTLFNAALVAIEIVTASPHDACELPEPDRDAVDWEAE